MVVLINGAFGIGKTTVARLLSQRLPGSVILDPERVGFVLQRFRRISGRPVEDFQDLRSWRRLSILGIRVARAFRPRVIVPMAISNASYLREIREGVARFEPRPRHFCLTAPLSVVQERLRRRCRLEHGGRTVVAVSPRRRMLLGARGTRLRGADIDARPDRRTGG